MFRSRRIAKNIGKWLAGLDPISNSDEKLDSDGMVDGVSNLFSAAAHFDYRQAQVMGMNFTDESRLSTVQRSFFSDRSFGEQVPAVAPNHRGQFVQRRSGLDELE